MVILLQIWKITATGDDTLSDENNTIQLYKQQTSKRGVPMMFHGGSVKFAQMLNFHPSWQRPIVVLQPHPQFSPRIHRIPLLLS
jgi:hypothetical protein